MFMVLLIEDGRSLAEVAAAALVRDGFAAHRNAATSREVPRAIGFDSSIRQDGRNADGRYCIERT